MPSIDLLPVLLCIFIGAALYTSVGHGGATVYTAILTLFSFAIAPLVTLVLVMNIAAAAIAWVMYQQAGFLRPRLLLPFVVTIEPHYVAPFVAIVIIGALLGSFMGARRLPFRAVQVSLGFVLLIAAGRNLLG